MFSRTPRSALFPIFLLPSIPFRKRQLSSDSTASTASSTDSNGPSIVPEQYLNGHTSHLRCAKCATDICLTSQVISKGFTGRHGRAYLVSPSPLYSGPSHTLLAGATRPHPALPNTRTDAPSQRQLVTGAHTVSDVRCAFCNSMLGWKYDGAEEESQRYKVGKYILETKMVCASSDWEHDDLELPPGPTHSSPIGDRERRHVERRKGKEGAVGGLGSGSAGASQVEFDSQDEDECEDLFTGVWSPGLALKRRQNKSFRKAVVAELDGR